MPNHYVIVGATSAIALGCARLWLARGPATFTLVGRDASRLERAAADLRARNAEATVHVVPADFHDPESISRLAAGVCEAAPADLVLVAHGHLPDQRRCETDLAVSDEALQVNAVSPALFAQAFAREMARAGRGTLVVIGSVAGDRGRQSNYVYGASKALLDRFTQGLRHRFAGSNVHVMLVKPGPTYTPMTARLHAGGARLASVDEVARAIVDGADRRRNVVYAPARWWLVMMVIRHLPSAIFHRLKI